LRLKNIIEKRPGSQRRYEQNNPIKNLGNKMLTKNFQAQKNRHPLAKAAILKSLLHSSLSNK